MICRVLRSRAVLVIPSLFMLLTWSGCAGGFTFLEPRAPSATAPPSPPLTATTSAAVNTAVTATPAPRPAPLLTPPRTRQPRPARFVEAPDISYRNQVITEDVTWQGTVSVEGVLTVAPQATLAIAPGTTVRFRPTPGGETGLLLVRGRIRAAGTEAAPVTFTSGEVDPLPGDWHGIVVLDSSKKNLLEWCRIEAAVTGVTLEFSELVMRQTVVTRSQTGLAVHASHVIATGGGATECADGITSADGDVDLSEVSISGTQRGITVRGGSLFLAASGVTAVKGAAVAAKGARLHLEGARIAGNGTGIELDGCRGDLTGTRIEDNRTVGLDVADSPLRMTGNRIAGNREGGIMVRSGRGVLWDNTIEANGGFDLVNAGIDEVMAPSNWWGTADPAAVRGRVRQRCHDGVCGALLVEPVLGAPPAAR